MEMKLGVLDFSRFLTPDDFVALLIIGLLSFFGSVGKDYLAMFSYHRRMNPIRIALSTITSSLVIFGASEVILEYNGVKGLMLSSFLCGLVGFELLQRVSTLRGLFEFLEKLVTLKKFLDNAPKISQNDDDAEYNENEDEFNDSS